MNSVAILSGANGVGASAAAGAKDQSPFRHLTMLRKALTSSRSGTFDLIGKGWSGSLQLTGNHMLDGRSESVDALSHALSQPVESFFWTELPVNSTCTMEPGAVFGQAINNVQFDEHYQERCAEAFAKLGTARLRGSIVNYLSRSARIDYQLLFRLGLSARGADLGQFLYSGCEETRERRLRVLLMAYCLGDLVPVVSEVQAVPESASRPSDRSGIVGRILNRLRGS